MKARLAAAALLLAAATASAALNAYRTGITLPQAVKLGDGSVLPAGRYDVQIDYKGFGNSAELHFFQGGVLKGKTPAEARGFPAQAPGGAAEAYPVKWQKGSSEVKIESAPEVKLEKVVDPGLQKGVPGSFPKVEAGEKQSPAGSPAASFSWGAHGFNPGVVGKTAPSGRSLKLSFDSANSAAGFSALLPAVQKQK